MANFNHFAKLTASAFQDLTLQSNGRVLVVDIEGTALYDAYLAAFPEGTNPLSRKQTEHDCSCCRQFIRRIGNVVRVDNEGNMSTVWDAAAQSGSYPHNEVAAVLQGLVKAAPIVDLFLVNEKELSFGAKETQTLEEDGSVTTWKHLHTGLLASAYRSSTADSTRGDHRTSVQVFERGLKELSVDAVSTVLSLIEANSLYRGSEHLAAITKFQHAQAEYSSLPEGRARDLYVWVKASGPASRFRNTVIGTLVQDLSNGEGVERAVRSFEAKVAPQNYKRTTAVITPGMVKAAMAIIKELGIEPALKRRFARIDDISVNDVLWVDNTVKPMMKGGIGTMLMKHAEASRSSSVKEEDAENIAIADFVAQILPQATAMEVLFKGDHVPNLMSLTAPVCPDPQQLFSWDNDFAWSYGGNVTDSIKERVKKAGGNVTNAVLRISLSWYNYDDLDIHVREPNGNPIYYGNKSGKLDVDMNVGNKGSREAVENVSWAARPADGAYKVRVHNYSKRETSDVGFVVEIENGGNISHFTYTRSVENQKFIEVATLTVKNGAVVGVTLGDQNITTDAVSQEVWGLDTNTFVKVSAVTLSPNYWGDNAVGNKHTFFVLDGAKNTEPTRGIYNEFLHPRLIQHRKVFEVIGDQTKCQPTEGQLSGLGFSSTKPDAVIVKVVSQGNRQRLFNVIVGA